MVEPDAIKPGRNFSFLEQYLELAELICSRHCENCLIIFFLHRK